MSFRSAKHMKAKVRGTTDFKSHSRIGHKGLFKYVSIELDCKIVGLGGRRIKSFGGIEQYL